MAILMKQEPKNLPAQAKLFNSSKVDEATRMELERRFATFSAAAVDRMLGLTAGERGRRIEVKPTRKTARPRLPPCAA